MPIPPAQRDPSRPNILWICTDSQRWDTLGCTGNPFVRTPNLDRLAAGGVRFSHAFTQSPLCTPSRGSFLTGRYPVTNRLRQNGQRCPEDLRLLPRILADAGWTCGLSGKLHLDHCDQRLALGKEWWREDKARWDIIGTERRIADGYHEFHWDHAANQDHRGSAYADWLQQRGRRITRRPHPDCDQVEIGPEEEDHQTTYCAEMAMSFMRRHAGATYPWLFSFNCFDPHARFDPPAAYLEPYLARLDELPDPDEVAGEMASKPKAQQDYYAKQSDWHALVPRQHRLVRAAYWAMCDLIDVQVGRMLTCLEETGQLANTLVIFHSDHGELLGDHGVYIKDQFLYDCSIRVPLLFSWPGRIRGGMVCDDLVELTDVAPTLIDACGLPPEPGMQGRSLWPYLTGAGGPGPREDVYCEFYGANPKRVGSAPRFASMVRTREHKLVRVHGGAEGELYDLRADPGEHRNLWDHPGHIELRSAMLQRLSDRQAFTADPLPERVGVY